MMDTANTTCTNKGKRTNSLAFAQTDCHTCTTVGDRCDRRRPRCTTCLGQGRRCDGFATSLSWNPKRMFSTKNPLSTTVDETTEDLSSRTRTDPILESAIRPPPGPGPPPLRFRFVGDRSKSRKRRRTDPAQRNDASQYQSVLPEAQGGSVVVSSAERAPVLEGENLDMTGDGDGDGNGQLAHATHELSMLVASLSLARLWERALD